VKLAFSFKAVMHIALLSVNLGFHDLKMFVARLVSAFW